MEEWEEVSKTNYYSAKNVKLSTQKVSLNADLCIKNRGETEQHKRSIFQWITAK